MAGLLEQIVSHDFSGLRAPARSSHAELHGSLVVCADAANHEAMAVAFIVCKLLVPLAQHDPSISPSVLFDLEARQAAARETRCIHQVA